MFDRVLNIHLIRIVFLKKVFESADQTRETFVKCQQNLCITCVFAVCSVCLYFM